MAWGDGSGYANCVYKGSGGLKVRAGASQAHSVMFTIYAGDISRYQGISINYNDGDWIGWYDTMWGCGQVYSSTGGGDYWVVTSWTAEGSGGGGTVDPEPDPVSYTTVNYYMWNNSTGRYEYSRSFEEESYAYTMPLTVHDGDDPVIKSSSTFNITLNKNDGSGITDTITVTKTTSKTYTSFVGWSTSSSSITGSAKYPISDSMYVGGSTMNLYPVFSSSSGVSSSSSYSSNATIQPKNNYKGWSKTGSKQCILYYTNKSGGTGNVSANQIISYAFSGWSESSGGPVLTANKKYTSAKTLYAIWSTTYTVTQQAVVTIPAHSNPSDDTNVFTVQFNTSGGNNVNSMQCGTRSYTFNRWELSDGSAFGYNSGDSYTMPSTSVSIKESWNSSVSDNVIYLPSATKNDGKSQPYAITLNYGNGQSDEARTIYKTHTSYEFNSWYKDNGLSQYAGGSGAEYTVNSSHTLFAKWDATSVEGENISDAAWDDTVEDVVTSLNYDYNSISESKTSYRTTKHVFNGWYDGSTKVNTSPYIPTANKTLTAKWTNTSRYDSITLNDISRPMVSGTKYYISYNGNGGSPGRDSEEVTVGRIEYIFDGWFIGNTKYSSSYTPTALTNELTAHWTEIPTNQKAILPNASREPIGGDSAYVTLDPNGGMVDGSLNLATSSGTTYEFAGWYDSASGVNRIGGKGDQYIPSGTLTYIELFAKWNETVAHGTIDLPTPTRTDITKYTVTLDAGDGVFSNSSVHTETHAASIKTEYTFLGWFNESEKVSDPYKPPVNTRTYLTARWEGKGAVNTPITLTTPTYRIESDMAINLYDGINTTPTVKNVIKATIRQFKGWFLNGIRIDTASDKYMPTKSGITINAQWSEDTCEGIAIDDVSRSYTREARNITLDVNGGSSIGDNTLTAIQEKTYTFLGWFNARTGGDSMVDKEGIYYPDPKSNATTINMYAHWSTVTKNTKIDLPTSTKFGYTLLGWAPEGSNTPVENPYMPSENGITLYAIWDFIGKVLVGGKKCIVVVGRNGKWVKLWPHIFKDGKFKPTKL